MRKPFLFLMLLWISIINICHAQHIDSLDFSNYIELEEKTFVIRKDSNQLKTPLTNGENAVAEVGSEVRLISHKIPQFAIQPPKLASDEKGLFYHMQLTPFSSRMLPPQNVKYVVFSFSISTTGNVDSIEIFDTNDPQLVDIIVYKLNYTSWNPAQTIDGDWTTYNYGKWIAIIPPTLNEHDYEQHRY